MKPVKILIVSDCVACAAHAPAGTVLTVSAQEAACLLGLGRATLYRKVEEYGIERT